MSWTIWNVPYESDEKKNLFECVAAHPQSGAAPTEQLTAAVEAALHILKSGAVGEGPYFVNLVGHENPEHKPREGWANDTVTVTVSQAPR